MKKLVELTSWQIIPPKPYGLFHLTFFIVGMIICIYLVKKLKNLNDKQNKMLLFFTGLFLLIIEIYKQFFYFYIVNNGHYDFSVFPFQLCDVPMVLCLIIPFIKSERVLKGMYNFMVSYNLLGGFITFLEPSALCRPYLMMMLHGFVWHLVLVFIGLYLAFSNRCLKNKKDFVTSIKVYMVLCVISLALNFLLKDVSNGSMNAFYLGPSTSPIIVFETISLKFGWFVNMVLFILVMTIGAYLVYMVFYNLNKRLRKECSHEN